MFTKERGKAVMRYKMFAEDHEWKPKTPTDPTAVADSSSSITVPRLAAVGGLGQFYQHLVGSTTDMSLQELAESSKNIRVMHSVTGSNVQELLRELDVSSLTSMQARLDAQSEGLETITPEVNSRWSKEETEKY